MLAVPQQVKIFVALQPTDMRRGFPGLSGELQSTLQQDPLSGHLFLFRNRRRDRIKILFWDGDGYVVYYVSEGGKWFVPHDELPVLIHDRLPAYITWEQYLANQEQLRDNRALKGSRGAPRRG